MRITRCAKALVCKPKKSAATDKSQHNGVRFISVLSGLFLGQPALRQQCEISGADWQNFIIEII